MNHTVGRYLLDLELEPLLKTLVVVFCSCCCLQPDSWMENVDGAMPRVLFLPDFLTQLGLLGNCTQCYHSARPNVAFIGPTWAQSVIP